jgi:hypothetical protein
LKPQLEHNQILNIDYWISRGDYYEVDQDLLPEVTFENSPMEVELKIKKNGLHFSPMFRLLGMIINKDPSDRKRIVGYTKKLIDNLKEEGFDADARVAEDYLKAFNGEQVGMATMDDVELKLIEK